MPGRQRLDLRGRALCFHLWHPPASRANLAANDGLLEKTVRDKIARCEHGLDRHFRPMENILLIRLKAIGDVIFTLPAVHALREHFPAAKITFLTSKENAALLRGFPQVNDVIALDRAALRSGHPWKMGAEFFGLLRRLRAGRFSLVVDFQGFGETAWLARITGAPQRWGSVYGAGPPLGLHPRLGA